MTESETTASTRRIVVDREKLVGIHSVAVAAGGKPVAVGRKPGPVDELPPTEEPPTEEPQTA